MTGQLHATSESFALDKNGKKLIALCVYLADIIKQILGEDVNWAHWIKRKPGWGHQNGEYIPKVATGSHFDVLDWIAVCDKSTVYTIHQDIEVLLQENNVCCIFGHRCGRVHWYPYISSFQCWSIIDTISKKSNSVSFYFQCLFKPFKLLGKNMHRNGGGKKTTRMLNLIQTLSLTNLWAPECLVGTRIESVEFSLNGQWDLNYLDDI